VSENEMFKEVGGRGVSEQRRENLKAEIRDLYKTFAMVKVTKSMKLLQRSGYQTGIAAEAWNGYRYLKGLASWEAARSRAWDCDSSLPGIAGSNLSVFYDCCVLSDRGLCVGLITRTGAFYRVWCV
jgi:hypothetical protein